MKYYILASLIIFSITIYHAIRRSNEITARDEKNFWDKENQANSVRKKSLDSLNYLHIPMDRFPTSLLTDNPTIRECIERGTVGFRQEFCCFA